MKDNTNRVLALLWLIAGLMYLYILIMGVPSAA